MLPARRKAICVWGEGLVLEDRTDLVAHLQVGIPSREGRSAGMSYEEKESVLAPADGVLFCTDGLVEEPNPRGEMLGTPCLRSLLSERPEGGGSLSATLLEELKGFTGEA